MNADNMNADHALGSLVRGLEILDAVRRNSRMRSADIAEELSLPLSTVYRYLRVLKSSGFLIDVDRHVVPSQKLTESDDGSGHLVRYAAPVLKRLSIVTSMTAVLTVRVHAAALCLDAVSAHPKHRISYQRGEVRALYAGASALPLLAYAPESILREVLDGSLRRFTAATPGREGILRAVRQTRRDGYATSEGHLNPGMVGFGVPVMVGGRCMCALSLIGDTHALPRHNALVAVLQASAKQLADQMPVSVMEEAWSGTNE